VAFNILFQSTNERSKRQNLRAFCLLKSADYNEQQ